MSSTRRRSYSPAARRPKILAEDFPPGTIKEGLKNRNGIMSDWFVFVNASTGKHVWRRLKGQEKTQQMLLAGGQVYEGVKSSSNPELLKSLQDLSNQVTELSSVMEQLKTEKRAKMMPPLLKNIEGLSCFFDAAVYILFRNKQPLRNLKTDNEFLKGLFELLKEMYDTDKSVLSESSLIKQYDPLCKIAPIMSSGEKITEKQDMKEFLDIVWSTLRENMTPPHEYKLEYSVGGQQIEFEININCEKQNAEKCITDNLAERLKTEESKEIQNSDWTNYARISKIPSIRNPQHAELAEIISFTTSSTTIPNRLLHFKGIDREDPRLQQIYVQSWEGQQPDMNVAGLYLSALVKYNKSAAHYITYLKYGNDWYLYDGLKPNSLKVNESDVTDNSHGYEPYLALYQTV